jgi:hypothetical protein
VGRAREAGPAPTPHAHLCGCGCVGLGAQPPVTLLTHVPPLVKRAQVQVCGALWGIGDVMWVRWWPMPIVQAMQRLMSCRPVKSVHVHPID